MIRGNNLKGKNLIMTMKNIGKLISKSLKENKKILVMCDYLDKDAIIHYTVMKHAEISNRESKDFGNKPDILKKILDTEKDIHVNSNLNTLFFSVRKGGVLLMHEKQHTIEDFDILIADDTIISDLTKDDLSVIIDSKVKKIFKY